MSCWPSPTAPSTTRSAKGGRARLPRPPRRELIRRGLTPARPSAACAFVCPWAYHVGPLFHGTPTQTTDAAGARAGPPPDDARGSGRARVERARHRPRVGRRVRRPPLLRRRRDRPRARGGGLPRRNLGDARSAHARVVPRAGASAPFFGVTAGTIDSMVTNYTAAKRRRRGDVYRPRGAEPRPNRATIAYTAACRGAFPGVPVIVGGLEASGRRLAYYDYWEDAVRRSILIDSKADLLVWGMGERQVLEAARRLAARASAGHQESARGADLDGIPMTCVVRRRIDDIPSARLVPGFEAIVADRRDLVPLFEAVREERLAFERADRPAPRRPLRRSIPAAQAEHAGRGRPLLRPPLHARLASQL